jgi:uncharacterized protein YjbI with pentapeptide repeats
MEVPSVPHPAATPKRTIWQRFAALSNGVKAALALVGAVLPILTFIATRRDNFEEHLEAPAARLRSDNDAEWAQAIADLERLGTSGERASRVSEHLFQFVRRHALVDELPDDAAPCKAGAMQHEYTSVPDDVEAAVVALARMLGTAGDSANLRGAYLPGLNALDVPVRPLLLTRSCLRDASLNQLDHAQLDSADLSGAHLAEANLTEAQLRFAMLSDADLKGSILRAARLRGARLNRANLRFSDLSYVIAPETDFSGADLYCANLTFAHLEAARFHHVQNWPDISKFADAYMYEARGLARAQITAANERGASFDTIPPLERDTARGNAYNRRRPPVDPCPRGR